MTARLIIFLRSSALANTCLPPGPWHASHVTFMSAAFLVLSAAGKPPASWNPVTWHWTQASSWDAGPVTSTLSLAAIWATTLVSAFSSAANAPACLVACQDLYSLKWHILHLLEPTYSAPLTSVGTVALAASAW